MRKINQQDNAQIDLSEESLNNVTPFSFELALARGIIVEVTDWVGPEIGFGRSFYRTRVALTARVWDTLLQAYVRQKNGSLEKLFREKRNDILWLAAQALERATGSDATNFTMYLPMGQGIEDCKTLRVECRDREDRDYSQVLIGFPEDFLRL